MSVIKENREKLGLTMSQLAKKVGVSEGTVSRWESGNIENMKQNNIISVSKALGISPLDLLECDNVKNNASLSTEDKSNKSQETVEKRILNENYDKLNKEDRTILVDFSNKLVEKKNKGVEKTNTDENKLYPVNVISACAAGIGYTYGNNEYTTYYTDRNDLKPYDFATMVSGDSMFPKFNDGDIILLKQGYDNVNGDIYAIDYDGKSYVKKLYNDGDRYRLVSINDKYEPIKINIPIEPGIYFNIIGKVVDSFTPVK